MASAAALIGVGLASALQVAQGATSRSLANDRARTIEKIGQLEALEERRKGRQLRASQRVAFAKSGIDPGFGAPLHVGVEAANESELAALRTQFRFDVAATDIKDQGKADFFQGLVGGIGTLLGGLGKAGEAGLFSSTSSGAGSAASASGSVTPFLGGA